MYTTGRRIRAQVGACCARDSDCADGHCSHVRRYSYVLPGNNVRQSRAPQQWWDVRDYPTARCVHATCASAFLCGLVLTRAVRAVVATARFILNEIKLRPEHEELRLRHLAAVFGANTIITKTLPEATKLREHMAKSRAPLSTILTEDGHRISTSGMMGSRNSMPPNSTSTLGSL